jgi:hypothetical protein
MLRHTAPFLREDLVRDSPEHRVALHTARQPTYQRQAEGLRHAWQGTVRRRPCQGAAAGDTPRRWAAAASQGVQTQHERVRWAQEQTEHREQGTRSVMPRGHQLQWWGPTMWAAATHLRVWWGWTAVHGGSRARQLDQRGWGFCSPAGRSVPLRTDWIPPVYAPASGVSISEAAPAPPGGHHGVCTAPVPCTKPLAVCARP